MKLLIKNNKINFKGFKNIEKAYTEGVYADSPLNRKLGRVGMSYKEYNEKLNKSSSNSILDKEGNIDYKNLNIISDEIIKGTKRIDALNKEEEQGRVKGGRKNVEASIICKAIKQIHQNDTNFDADTRRVEEERLVLEYAKKEGCFFDKEKLDEIISQKLARGAESQVFIGKDNKYIIKAFNPYFMSENLDEALDNLSLFNFIFEETGYEVLGFGEIEEGFFNIILKQPLIQGETISYKVRENDNQREKTLDYKQKIYKDLSQRIGLIQYSGGNEYANSQYDIADVHLGNVMEVEGYEGLLYIDVNTSLTTKDDFTFGKREYGNGSIINND